MKNYFIFLTLLFILSGCSSKNAFDNFNMSKEQELGISSLQSVKVASQNGVVAGVFSSIYLNEVYPKSFSDSEYFFIYVYLKDSGSMYNPNQISEENLNIKLNGKTPIKIQKLPKDNKFSNLIEIRSKWNKYYMVAFSHEKKDSLNLVFENEQSSSAAIKYQKDEL